MIQLIEYAVRVKGTQKYLVRSQRRDGRGGSHLEPRDFADRSAWPQNRYNQAMQIRSYATRSAAQNLLTSWSKGKWVGRHWDPDGFYEYHEPKKGTERDPNMLEVVELIITLPF